MQRKRVMSSNLVSVGYDLERSILEVEFLNGTVYQYFNVPQRVYTELMNVTSHGSYLDTNVKKAGYRYRQLR